MPGTTNIRKAFEYRIVGSLARFKLVLLECPLKQLATTVALHGVETINFAENGSCSSSLGAVL